MLLELVQRVPQMAFAPDQGPVQQFAPAGLHPTLRDRIHARHPDPGEHDLDASLAQDRVEDNRVLRVAVTNQILDGATGVLKIHHKVACCLGNPVRGGMRRGAEDPYAAAGVLDRRENVLAPSGQRDGLHEVARQENLCVLLAVAHRQQPQGREGVGDSQVRKTKQRR